MRLWAILLLLCLAPSASSAELRDDWKGQCSIDAACARDNCTFMPILSAVRLGKNWTNGEPTLNGEPALLFKSRSEAETYLASNQVPDDLWLILVEGDPSVEDGFDLYVHSLTWAGKQPVLAKNSALISCVRGG